MTTFVCDHAWVKWILSMGEANLSLLAVRNLTRICNSFSHRFYAWCWPSGRLAGIKNNFKYSYIHKIPQVNSLVRTFHGFLQQISKLWILLLIFISAQERLFGRCRWYIRFSCHRWLPWQGEEGRYLWWFLTSLLRWGKWRIPVNMQGRSKVINFCGLVRIQTSKWLFTIMDQ